MLRDLAVLNPDAWEPSPNGTIRYMDIASINGPGRVGPFEEILDWQNKEDVQRTMRRDIKRELRKVEGLSGEQIEELARTMVEIARSKTARA